MSLFLTPAERLRCCCMADLSLPFPPWAPPLSFAQSVEFVQDLSLLQDWFHGHLSHWHVCFPAFFLSILSVNFSEICTGRRARRSRSLVRTPRPVSIRDVRSGSTPLSPFRSVPALPSHARPVQLPPLCFRQRIVSVSPPFFSPGCVRPCHPFWLSLT